MTAARILGAYKLDHPRCELHRLRCQRAADATELHHILGGARRIHEPWNLLHLCGECHRVVHAALSFWRFGCVWLKVRRGEWDGAAAWRATNPGRPYSGEYETGYPLG